MGIKLPKMPFFVTFSFGLLFFPFTVPAGIHPKPPPAMGWGALLEHFLTAAA